MKFLKKWITNNIFDFRKGDASAYMVLNFIIPFLITYHSIGVLSGSIEIVYCYLTVLISAISCIYDAANRWVGKSFKNAKLFIVLVSCASVCVYAAYIVFSVLITKSVSKFDWILLLYLFVLLVALPDAIASFVKDM